MGSIANFVAYSAVMEVGDRVLGMHFRDGGHISHGLKVGEKVLSHTAKMYNWENYGLDEQGWLDYEDLRKVRKSFN